MMIKFKTVARENLKPDDHLSPPQNEALRAFSLNKLALLKGAAWVVSACIVFVLVWT